MRNFITEAQRQGAQMLAAELRQRLAAVRRHALLCDDLRSHGMYDAFVDVGVWIDELCPPEIAGDDAAEPLTVVLPFDDGNFAIRFSRSHVNGGFCSIRYESHIGPPDAAFAWGKTVKQPHEIVEVWGRRADGEQVCAFSEEPQAVE
jgi:hypothetical protein